MALSSSWLGHKVFILITWVQIPQESPTAILEIQAIACVSSTSAEKSVAVTEYVKLNPCSLRTPRPLQAVLVHGGRASYFVKFKPYMGRDSRLYARVVERHTQQTQNLPFVGSNPTFRTK